MDTKNIVVVKSIEFALEIITYCESLEEKGNL